jgi:putative Holliday junction resolvase
MPVSPSTILALDIGTRRTGVAIANDEVRFPAPLCTLDQDDAVIEKLQALIQEHNVHTLVVGLPRGLDGQETGQTKFVEDFVVMLKPKVKIPIFMQDEALTSRKAEAELDARGKIYSKGEIDALAATYILEDFIAEHPKGVR